MAKASAGLYPLFLDLRGVPVLVAGGGAVAERKAAALARAGARVTLVAPRFTPALARRSGLRRFRRPFRRGDLAGARLVFAATGDASLNRAIGELARARGLWVNVAAPPEAGNVQVPSCLRRGTLCIAVSTGGASAAAARTLRRELARRIGTAWGALLALLAARRARIKTAVADPARRRRLLRTLGGPEALRVLRARGRRETARWMDRRIAEAASA